MSFNNALSPSAHRPTLAPNSRAAEYVADWQLFPDDPDEETYLLADAEAEAHDVSEQAVMT